MLHSFPCLQCLLILIGYAEGQRVVSAYSVLQQMVWWKSLDVSTKYLSVGCCFGRSSFKKTVGGKHAVVVNYWTDRNSNRNFNRNLIDGGMS